MYKSCWVLVDHGKIGTLNQCLGLAEFLSLDPVVKFVTARLPWRWLPPVLWPFSLKCLHQQLSPPWPDIVIAGGRISAIPAATIRRLSQGHTKVIQLLNPKISPHHFNAVIVPQHDQVIGNNVIHTLGTFHRVTPERLAESAFIFESQFAHLPKPYLAVLIGGSNDNYRLDQHVMTDLIQYLRQLVLKDCYSLLVSVSRRTDKQIAIYLRKQLADLPIYFWDNQEPNPYYAYLSLADKIIVTGDSISMITEAASTGKPVYIYKLPGHSAKFERFYQAMLDGQHSRFFSYPFVAYTPQIVDNYQAIALRLMTMLR